MLRLVVCCPPIGKHQRPVAAIYMLAQWPGEPEAVPLFHERLLSSGMLMLPLFAAYERSMAGVLEL